MSARPGPRRLDHLLALSDDIGTFEHADHAEPRREHGYCTDDMARVLIAVCREPHLTRPELELGRLAFGFLTRAQAVGGRVRNRRTVRGRWTGRRTVDDCWGRSLWGFGTAAGRGPEPWMRESALHHFTYGSQVRSPSRRSMTFAGLGAAEVLAVHPDHRAALQLLADAADAIGPIDRDAAWPWPEPRLSYANAAIAEVLIAAGDALGRPSLLDDGLRLLAWLLERETVGGHLSPTPVGGAGPGDQIPRFDQQPIEAAAMADACARALAVTSDARWSEGLARAGWWFAGANDAGELMWDARTGGGFDGLHASAVNQNQGAESTIALVTTMQHVEAACAAVP